jgi:hypothetical protein
MKTSFASALSLVGVLAAGTAAAMANTSIFDSGSNAANSSVFVPPSQTVDLVLPEVSASDSAVLTAGSETETAVDGSLPEPSSTGGSSTSASASSSTSSSGAKVSASAVGDEVLDSPADSPVSFLTAFNVGDAGTVTVDVVNGSLLIVDTAPQAGWTVETAQMDSVRNSVKVAFVDGTVRVIFTASFDGATISPSVRSEPMQSSYYDDDDHDDDHDDDDHDDDDDDDDDDDHHERDDD